MDEIKDLVRAALAQGWRVDRTKGKQHWRFWPPVTTLAPEIFPGTPSDVRAIRNFVAALRRKGFVWPWPR